MLQLKGWVCKGPSRLTEHSAVVFSPFYPRGNSSFSAVKKEVVTLTRFRIGHTCRSRGHLLRGEPAPVCITCGVSLTVSHILVDVPRHDEPRRVDFIFTARYPTSLVMIAMFSLF
jgi:hypothetical protein